MPKPNTLTFPLSQTPIIFLGHSNSTMLHHFHFSYHSMSCTARHDASKVPIKPLLDSALDFSTVKSMMLTKVVLRNSELLFGQFNWTKINKKYELNRTTPSWVGLLARDWDLIIFTSGRERPIAVALLPETFVCRDTQLKIWTNNDMNEWRLK